MKRVPAVYLIGLVGLSFVLATGCTKKELDASASGKSFVPPAKPGAKAAGGTTTSGGLSGTGGSLEASGSDAGLAGLSGTEGGGGGALGEGTGLGSGLGPGSGDGFAGGPGGGLAGDAAGTGFGDGAAGSGSKFGDRGAGAAGTGTGGAFPPLGGPNKGGSGDILVAKAEPSDATRRQLEQFEQEKRATALAGLNDVYFAFDSWKLTEDGKRALERDAEWLKANPDRGVTIEGYCDERGTVAYNLVLGEKRAKAARNYLVELGVPAGRLVTVSYGKERPFCMDHDEGCYQQNRRAHLSVKVQ